LGFASLILYILTLLPTIMRVVFPETKKSGIPKMLLKNRRTIGVVAFFLALGHGVLLVLKRNFDFGDFQTSVVYLQGILLMGIFTLLAVTSNDWSIKKLKKNWKKLHQLTYLAMFLLTWHVADKMLGHWTYLTPLGIIGSTAITVLFVVRKWMEYQKESAKKTKAR
ncbi:MAG: ferric reductase-like transmembrane domain-containing protein, partial [Cyanobacteriota bacterium]|nr:ferric reductase-like transmembrane domain-containing protein [Cyanobacteriota bacterium]